MPQQITPIYLRGVNTYLIRAGDGFILIDSGMSMQRAALEKALVEAGCKPGSLKLILLTHGDSDHAGNCRYLHEKYGAPVAMHADDVAMVEKGDMAANRRGINLLTRIIFSLPFLRLGKRDRFSPDRCIADGDYLSRYGLEARVVGLPGHTRGSIGLLVAGGDLFCGDLLTNTGKPAGKPAGNPAFSFAIDDAEAANASIEKLKQLGTVMVYPGHGKPFPFEAFERNRQP